MESVLKFYLFGRKSLDGPIETPAESPSVVSPSPQTSLLKTLAWLSAGAAALALGLFVGRELRVRYKFSRRTPYDFYAHSGDAQDIEFGVGI